MDTTEATIADQVLEFMQNSPKNWHLAKFIANHIHVPVESVNFVLMELHYDGVLQKKGTYYGQS